jgi:anti-sigma-K factor RskA
MSARDHTEYEENIGAYVLGALSELEAEVFERHLAGCVTCHEEVAHLRVAADALARSVDPIPPPDSLKASLMETVRAEAAEDEPARRPRPSLLRRLLPEPIRVRPAAALAAVVVLLAVGVGAGVGVSQLSNGGHGGTRTVAAAFDATPRMAQASGNLEIPGGGSNTATLRLHGMPSLPRDETYQVWVKRRGEVVPQAIFSVGDDGSALTAVGEDLGGADDVLVTREPAGGSRAPTTAPVVRVKL